MVHRIQNRNTGYTNNFASTLVNNQTTLNATEGATALNLNNVVEENTNAQQKQEEIKENIVQEPQIGNISIENATYLQNLENTSEEKNEADRTPNFEVDSIELATPELFSENNGSDSLNIDEEKDLRIFEKSNQEEETTLKEPEMFEESNMEEDFEIPAFLRKQKN